MFCELHDQLASLDRHAQLTRCFSAFAELLVLDVLTKIRLKSMKRAYENLPHSAALFSLHDFPTKRIR